MADYYDILGIKKDASSDEIKTAFRNLAQKYHPDKTGGDAAKFKEVNEAYQVLSDPEKRPQYDQYGHAFEQARAQGGFTGFEGFRDWASFMEAMGARQNSDQNLGGFDFSDLGDIFSGVGEMFGFSSPRRRTKTGEDIEAEIVLSFKEAAFGGEKIIEIDRDDVCSECRGSGAVPGSQQISCRACAGRGQVRKIQSSIFGRFESIATCDQCGGLGKVSKESCRYCGGDGILRLAKRLKVKIPAGIDNGETIRIRGEGGKSKSDKAGDFYLHIRVQKDPNFSRSGYNILSKVSLSLTQAVLGAVVEVSTIHGPVMLRIPSGTHSGTVFRVRGKGIPYLKESRTGDHLIEVLINIPQRLSKKQKELLEELKKEGL